MVSPIYLNFRRILWDVLEQVCLQSKTFPRILISSRVFRGTPESRLGFLLELEVIRCWLGTWDCPELLPDSGSWNSRASDKKSTLPCSSLIWVRSWLTVSGSRFCCIECSSNRCWVNLSSLSNFLIIIAMSPILDPEHRCDICLLLECILHSDLFRQPVPLWPSLLLENRSSLSLDQTGSSSIHILISKYCRNALSGGDIDTTLHSSYEQFDFLWIFGLLKTFQNGFVLSVCPYVSHGVFRFRIMNLPRFISVFLASALVNRDIVRAGK